MHRTVLGGQVTSFERPWMVVVADVRVLDIRQGRRPGASDVAVRTLVSRGIPVVLASADPATSVRPIQSILGLDAPFISAGGAELHVPRGYFENVHGLGPRSADANVIAFGTRTGSPEFTRAIQLLLGLFWNHGDKGMVVGVSDRESTLLAAADIPILVRNPDIDQVPLRKSLPDAYYTSATGSAGWAEGILGPVETWP